jgi:hypothetical protein
MYFPGTEESIGTLNARQCFAVMERGEERTRIWARAPGLFQGELDVPNQSLAYVLVDDIPMRLSAGGEPYGEALSGGLVRLESNAGVDTFLAVMIEGRVKARFLVTADEIFPATSWTVPDPEDLPDASWPEATLPLPPEKVALTQRPSGYDVRAEVEAPLFDVTDVLLDPAMGELRMALLEERSFEARVRLVGRQFWVEGWVASVDWRSDPPESGWNPMTGIPGLRTVATGTRQLGSKDADLALEPKGDAFATIPAGAWVTLEQEDGSWQQIRVSWRGGEARGWIEKKRLEREKKQGKPPEPEVSRVAAISLGKVAVEWYDAEGHDLAPGLTPDAVRGLAVQGIETLRRQYAEALRSRPNLTGEVVARLVVTPDGMIFEQSNPVATLADEDVVAVLDATMEALVFAEIKPRKRQLDNNLVVWMQWVFKPLGE